MPTSEESDWPNSDRRSSNIQLVNGARAKALTGISIGAVALLFIGAMVTISTSMVSESRKELTQVLVLTSAIQATQVANSEAIKELRAWRNTLPEKYCALQVCDRFGQRLDALPFSQVDRTPMEKKP